MDCVGHMSIVFEWLTQLPNFTLNLDFSCLLFKIIHQNEKDMGQ